MTRAGVARSWPFAAYWLAGLLILAWSGTLIHGYKLYVMNLPPPHPYPRDGVLWMMAVMSVEALLFLVLIRPWSYRASWRRALIAFVVSLVPLVLFVPIMHTPPYFVWQWIWLLGGWLTLFALCFFSLGVARVRIRADQ